MRRSLLSLLRGADGHSLARALACLLLVNAVVTGFASAAAIAAEPASVVCSIADNAAAPDTPATAHDSACCDMGCGPTAPALAAEPVAAPNAPVTRAIGIVLPRVVVATPPASLPGHGPRGPPLLA